MIEKLQKGNTIYCLVRSVAPSGLSRLFSVFMVFDGIIYDITNETADKLKFKMTTRISFRVSGCGMDMAWWLTNELSRSLFGEENQLRYNLL